MAVTIRAAKRTRISTHGVVFRSRILGYLLLAPAMIYIIGLVAIPFFLALKFSVTDATVSNLNGERGFIGLAWIIHKVISQRAGGHLMPRDEVYGLSAPCASPDFATTGMGVPPLCDNRGL